MSNMSSNFDQFSTDITLQIMTKVEKMREQLYLGMEEILVDANTEVPVLSGALESTGTVVRVSSLKSEIISIEYGGPTQGHFLDWNGVAIIDVDYAQYQHENSTYAYEWLTDAFRRNIFTVIEKARNQ